MGVVNREQNEQRPTLTHPSCRMHLPGVVKRTQVQAKSCHDGLFEFPFPFISLLRLAETSEHFES